VKPSTGIQRRHTNRNGSRSQARRRRRYRRADRCIRRPSFRDPLSDWGKREKIVKKKERPSVVRPSQIGDCRTEQMVTAAKRNLRRGDHTNVRSPEKMSTSRAGRGAKPVTHHPYLRRIDHGKTNSSSRCGGKKKEFAGKK